MAPITINWSDLEIAFERNSPEQESFLDLENGDLLSIAEGEPDAAARRAKVANNPDRYLRIDPASSREQYRWMERFVGAVQDLPLRERLLVAIDGKGAFRRFKDVLLAFPAERERWFAYRSELLHLHIQTWIDHLQIEAANPPPWGRVVARPETAEVTHMIPSGESPGEILRRQAREVIDEIPAAEMPTAIVFLEFPRERGAASLLGGISADMTAPDRTSEELPRQSGQSIDHDDLRDEQLQQELHKGAVAS